MKTEYVVLAIFRVLYVLTFGGVSLYLWIYYPNFDNEYKGILRNVELVSSNSADFYEDTTSVYLLNIEFDEGKTKSLKCRNFANWPNDTLSQYIGQKLTISTLKESVHVKHGTRTVSYPERVVRIQDEEGFDLPKSLPCWGSGKIEYGITTFILYVLGFLLCVYLLRKWIMQNIVVIIVNYVFDLNLI